MTLISAGHPIFKRLRRLSRQRKERSNEGAFVIDGPKLLAEALDAGIAIGEVVAEPDAPADLIDQVGRRGATVHWAPAQSLMRVTDPVTPQPVVAIAGMRELTLEAALDGLDRPELVLVLAGINDPGNAGTLVRSADAVGAGAVVFCADSVDPYNPKCVRASAGSLFRVRVVRSADAAETLRSLRDRGVLSIGTAARGSRPYDQVDLTRRAAIVIGSEARGLTEAVRAQLDEQVTIPMRPPLESLNAAMAGTLVCFEARRQREANSRNPLDDVGSSGAGCSAA